MDTNNEQGQPADKSINVSMAATKATCGETIAMTNKDQSQDHGLPAIEAHDNPQVDLTLDQGMKFNLPAMCISRNTQADRLEPFAEPSNEDATDQKITTTIHTASENWLSIDLNPIFANILATSPASLNLVIQNATSFQIAFISNVLTAAKKGEILNVAMAGPFGSGKTLAFMVPIANWLLNIIMEHCLKKPVHSPQAIPSALIIVPTNPLAQQHQEIAENLFKSLSAAMNGKRIQQLPSNPERELQITMATGNIPIQQQLASLNANPHLMIATPGRLAHLVRDGKVDLKSLKYVVFDEAHDIVACEKDWKELSGPDGVFPRLQLEAKDASFFLVSPERFAEQSNAAKSFLSSHYTSIHFGKEIRKDQFLRTKCLFLPSKGIDSETTARQLFNTANFLLNKIIELKRAKQRTWVAAGNDIKNYDDTNAVRTILIFVHKKLEVEYVRLLFAYNGNIQLPPNGLDGYGNKLSAEPILPDPNAFIPYHHDILNRAEKYEIIRERIKNRTAHTWTVVCATDILKDGIDISPDMVIQALNPPSKYDTEAEIIQRWNSRRGRTGRWSRDGVCVTVVRPEVDDYAAQYFIDICQRQGITAPAFLIDARDKFNMRTGANDIAVTASDNAPLTGDAPLSGNAPHTGMTPLGGEVPDTGETPLGGEASSKSAVSKGKQPAKDNEPDQIIE